MWREEMRFSTKDTQQAQPRSTQGTGRPSEACPPHSCQPHSDTHDLSQAPAPLCRRGAQAKAAPGPPPRVLSCPSTHVLTRGAEFLSAPGRAQSSFVLAGSSHHGVCRLERNTNWSGKVDQMSHHPAHLICHKQRVGTGLACPCQDVFLIQKKHHMGRSL